MLETILGIFNALIILNALSLLPTLKCYYRTIAFSKLLISHFMIRTALKSRIINCQFLQMLSKYLASSYALEQCLSILSPNVSSPRLLRKAFCGERQPPVFLNNPLRSLIIYAIGPNFKYGFKSRILFFIKLELSIKSKYSAYRITASINVL